MVEVGCVGGERKVVRWFGALKSSSESQRRACVELRRLVMEVRGSRLAAAFRVSRGRRGNLSWVSAGLVRAVKKSSETSKYQNVWIDFGFRIAPWVLMAEQRTHIKLEQGPKPPPEPTPPAALKLKTPNRNQFTFAAVDIEALLGPDHPARAIWELAGRLDLDGFAASLRTRQGPAGRPAWPPRLLVAVWIWAWSEGVSSARQIERLGEHHPARLWLCGLEAISHKNLSDFRSSHSEALDQLFTQVLALLSQEGLIELEQVTVDGTRLRSQAVSRLAASPGDPRSASGSGAAASGGRVGGAARSGAGGVAESRGGEKDGSGTRAGAGERHRARGPSATRKQRRLRGRLQRAAWRPTRSTRSSSGWS